MDQHVNFKDIDGIELANAFLEIFPIGNAMTRREMDDWAAAQEIYSVGDNVGYHQFQFQCDEGQDQSRRQQRGVGRNQKLQGFQLFFRRIDNAGNSHWAVVPVEKALEKRWTHLPGQVQTFVTRKKAREVRRLYKRIDFDKQTPASRAMYETNLMDYSTIGSTAWSSRAHLGGENLQGMMREFLGLWMLAMKAPAWKSRRRRREESDHEHRV